MTQGGGTLKSITKNKTGIGAVVGLLVGIAIGVIIHSPLAMLIAGFVCALAGDTIEEESKKGLKRSTTPD